MDQAKLTARLRSLFLEELEEHARGFGKEVAALEESPGPSLETETIKSLLRRAHSLKGAAAAVGYPEIATACHHMEETLTSVRDGTRALTPDVLELLVAAGDALEEAHARLRQQRDLTGAMIAGFGERPRERASSSAPAAAPTVEPQVTGAHPPFASALRSDVPRVVEPASVDPSSRPSPSSGAAPSISDGWVRVSTSKIDAMLRSSRELAVARGRLKEDVSDAASLHTGAARVRDTFRSFERALLALAAQDGSPRARHAAKALQRASEQAAQVAAEADRIVTSLARDLHELERIAAPCEEDVLRLRMAPFAEGCEPLGGAARDVARRAGKRVHLSITGGEVEVDRAVLEELRAPLLHLVRNAIDHGIEAPAERARASKPPEGRVSVSASLRSRYVEVVVEDDGRGLDLSAIREQARERSLPASDDPRELGQLLFLPGFTTRRAATEVSGRGVGLDVVKARVEALYGTVAVESKPGEGTRFTLTLPLTLTTLRALVVEAGGQLFALVTTSVADVMRLRAADVHIKERREVIRRHGEAISVARLDETLGLPPRERPHTRVEAVAVVVGSGSGAVAFVVDELLGEHEIVVKALGPRLRYVRHVAGAAVLGNGRIAMVLGAGELLRTALTTAPGSQVSAALARGQRSAKRRVLLADDSVTTRALTKSILEAAGYDILVAADGQQAWHILQEGSVDALVSDVEMPTMDGFALTEAIRASKRLHALPVVLLTGLASDESRARGVSAGANAYLVKSAFDQQELLETLSQLL